MILGRPVPEWSIVILHKEGSMRISKISHRLENRYSDLSVIKWQVCYEKGRSYFDLK